MIRPDSQLLVSRVIGHVVLPQFHVSDHGVYQKCNEARQTLYRLGKEMIDDGDAHCGTVQRDPKPLSCVSEGPRGARIPDADSLGL